MAFAGPARYIDRRARIALDAVTRAYATACDAAPAERTDVWVRRVRPRRDDLLDHLDIAYRLQNRFWARIYDFHVSTDVAREADLDEPRQKVEVRLDLGGLVGAKTVKFKATSPRGASLAEELSGTPEIADLIRALNLTDVRIMNGCEDETREWLIDTSSYVGSYTWNLIPPVYQAILPTAEEVNRHLELLAMLAHIVREPAT